MASAPDNSAGSPIGMATMSPAMSEMNAYCDYLYRLVESALGERVWEIGAGHGKYTSLMLASGKVVLATDIDQGCLDRVRQRFAESSRLSTAHVDLRDERSIRAHSHFDADSILCLNVLEHIADDVAAAAWLRQSVTPGARFALIVPALPGLYGRMDSEAGHYRRYTRAALHQVLASAGWRVTQLRYVNLLGACGWWYHNRVRKQAGLKDSTVNEQMKTIDRWLPRVARLTDPIFGKFGGLSLVAIAQSVGD